MISSTPKIGEHNKLEPTIFRELNKLAPTILGELNKLATTIFR